MWGHQAVGDVHGQQEGKLEQKVVNGARWGGKLQSAATPLPPHHLADRAELVSSCFSCIFRCHPQAEKGGWHQRILGIGFQLPPF